MATLMLLLLFIRIHLKWAKRPFPFMSSLKSNDWHLYSDDLTHAVSVAVRRITSGTVAKEEEEERKEKHTQLLLWLFMEEQWLRKGPFRSSNRENHRNLEKCQNISPSTEKTEKEVAMIHPG
ncbi:hypothetical protein CEXT_261161 [Caerostris extrusa]|uniref:Uncharacterized protein n=1 Tax=Caerostris extrusa TaxID=172846 RepID=A0AAV4U0C3_CAEEX|nr:hypothetical protein CEXT_261161 [Caerostris extrusa]